MELTNLIRGVLQCYVGVVFGNVEISAQSRYNFLLYDHWIKL